MWLAAAEFVGESCLTILFPPLLLLYRGHVHINSSGPFKDQVIVP